MDKNVVAKISLKFRRKLRHAVRERVSCRVIDELIPNLAGTNDAAGVAIDNVPSVLNWRPGDAHHVCSRQLLFLSVAFNV